MMELVEANWPVLAVALLLGLLVAWWIYFGRRRTRVSGDRRDVLDAGADPAARNQALIDSAPAVAVATPVAQTVPAASGVDDLTRIKGIGPKLRDLLASLGVTSFSQIAGWSDTDIDRIDSQLGQFEGRIRRDNWIEQAKLLAAGDTAGYENRFGKL
jgi:predicted flap endonuclease-1-like 5' DNA nuclease